MGSTASQLERSPESPEKQHSEEQQSPGEQHQHNLPERLEQPEDQPMALQALELPSAEQPFKDSLLDLGYEVTIYEARRYEVAKYPDMTFYRIREPSTHIDIGRFATYTDLRTLEEGNEIVVLELNTRADRRLGKPRAHEILAGFWQCTLQRDIRDLRSLYFDTVAEQDTVNVVRHHVCPLMQVAWKWHHHAPQADITLRDPKLLGTTAEQTGAWEILHDESKLVRMADSLLSAYPLMDLGGGRFQMKQLDILPQPNEKGRLFAFDLQVIFGV